jgi:hypothetical protein
VCATDRLSHHRIVMLFARLLEKDIRPGIDEEADIGCIRRLPGTPDAISLILGLAESSIRREAVLQVAAYSSRGNRQTDSLADNFQPVAIPAFEIDGHRQVRRAGDSPQIVDRQSIVEAVCMSDRPTAYRDRLVACPAGSRRAAVWRPAPCSV